MFEIRPFVLFIPKMLPRSRADLNLGGRASVTLRPANENTICTNSDLLHRPKSSEAASSDSRSPSDCAKRAHPAAYILLWKAAASGAGRVAKRRLTGGRANPLLRREVLRCAIPTCRGLTNNTSRSGWTSTSNLIHTCPDPRPRRAYATLSEQAVADFSTKQSYLASPHARGILPAAHDCHRRPVTASAFPILPAPARRTVWTRSHPLAPGSGASVKSVA